VKSDMKIILQRDYYTTLLHKTHNKIEEIIFDSFFFVACYQLTTTHHFEPFRSVAPRHILVHPMVHRAHRLKSAALMDKYS